MIFPVVLSLEVVEDVAGLADHFQQPATGMMVLDVRLEVVGQPVYPGREQCDLHFRGTRIARRALVLLDDLRLLRNAYPHALLSLCVFAKGRYFILKSAPSTSCFEVERASLEVEQALGLQCPARVNFARAEVHPVFAEDRNYSASGNASYLLTRPELGRQPS